MYKVWIQIECMPDDSSQDPYAISEPCDLVEFTALRDAQQFMTALGGDGRDLQAVPPTGKKDKEWPVGQRFLRPGFYTLHQFMQSWAEEFLKRKERKEL